MLLSRDLCHIYKCFWRNTKKPPIITHILTTHLSVHTYWRRTEKNPKKSLISTQTQCSRTLLGHPLKSTVHTLWSLLTTAFTNQFRPHCLEPLAMCTHQRSGDRLKQPPNTIKIWLSAIQPAFTKDEAWIKELPEQSLVQRLQSGAPFIPIRSWLQTACTYFTFWQHPINAASCWWCMLFSSMARVGQAPW